MYALTLFHRSTYAKYEGTLCDVANIGVVYASGKDKGKKAGFIGASWGEWPDAPDCLHVAVLDGSDGVEDKLTEWGLERDANQTDFPPEENQPDAAADGCTVI